MSGLRFSSSRSIFVPERGLPTTKNGGSARVTAARGSRRPRGLPAVGASSPGPNSRKGGARAAHPQGPGRQPRRDRPPRAAHGARAWGIAAVAVYSDADARRAARRRGRRGGAHRAAAESRVVPARSIASSTRRARRAPTPSTRATASSSENADFAAALRRRRADVFIGPPPEAIRAHGEQDRGEARSWRRRACRWSRACRGAGLDDAALAREAREHRLPAAGQGVGRRRRARACASCATPAELAEALAAARREARGAFGDDTLLLERYVERAAPRRDPDLRRRARHASSICFERECSIQRRYQKIIEEAPSPAVDAALRARMGAAAVAAGAGDRLRRRRHGRVRARRRTASSTSSR